MLRIIKNETEFESLKGEKYIFYADDLYEVGEACAKVRIGTFLYYVIGKVKGIFKKVKSSVC